MDFLDWRRECFIRKTLRRLSRQRVVGILRPGNIWIIEKSPLEDEKVEAALRTCHIRGWVEPLANAVPKGRLTKEGKLPDEMISDVGPIYRLTEAGWDVLRRIHGWVIATCIIAFVGLIATVISLLIIILGPR